MAPREAHYGMGTFGVGTVVEVRSLETEERSRPGSRVFGDCTSEDP